LTDIALSVESSYGAGPLIAFLPVRPGYGAPPVPSLTSVTLDASDSSALDVTWTMSAAATAYYLYLGDATNPTAAPTRLPFPVPFSPWIIGVFPDRTSATVCVQAINGSLSSALSTCVAPS
jgi:hypothetical protein